MKKKDLSTILLILVFIIGLSMLLYPTVSNLWNKHVQSKVIVNYDAILENTSKEDYTEYFKEADTYNELLKKVPYPLSNNNQVEGYDDILNITGTGIMGYLEIEKINLKLAIYHGTSEAVLSVGVGHLKGTSLPVGGKDTHCVLSGHRGLPSAELFTNLDRLQKGDVFTITVLDRTLTYEVDQISVVKPEEVNNLNIIEGEDYVTLLTCTPYGINSHRLLVRGSRIDNLIENNTEIQNEDQKSDYIVLASMIAALILVILLVILLIKYQKSKKDYQNHYERKEN